MVSPVKEVALERDLDALEVMMADADEPRLIEGIKKVIS